MERIDLTIDEVLDLLSAECTVPQFDPEHEFLVDQFASRSGLGMSTCSRHLDRMVGNGRLTMRWVKTPSGKRAKAYHHNQPLTALPE